MFGKILRALRARVTYANVVSSLALFVALGGVAWAALPINSVTQKQIRRGAVGASELKSNAVRSSKVKNDSLSALDIVESTLETPFARADNTGSCDPSGAAVPNCASVTYTPPRSAPVLIVAQVAWHTSGDTAPSSGTCQMRVDGVPVGESMLIGELGPTEDTDQQHTRTASGAAITDPVTTQSHEFAIACSEEDGNIDINHAAISTVLVGNG